jgi:hypothetical protein
LSSTGNDGDNRAAASVAYTQMNAVPPLRVHRFVMRRLGGIMEREIGNIGNYYGGLSVKEEDGKYFWSIENWDGHGWEEIPKSLYDELVRYDESLKPQEPSA